MPADELDGRGALVDDLDRVEEEPVAARRLGLIGRIPCGNVYANILSYRLGGIHVALRLVEGHE